MPSLQLNFDCSSLWKYCPAWQECVTCTSSYLKIGNDAFWALGSSASVATSSIKLKGRIKTIAIDTSVTGPEYNATITVKLIAGTSVIFEETRDITGKNVTLTFYVNKDIDDYFGIVINVSERGNISWLDHYAERTFSSPVITYEEITIPPPTPPTPSITVKSVSVLRMNSYTDKLYANEPVNYYSLRVEYTANCKGTGVAKITINGKPVPDVGVVWTDLFGVIVIDFSQFSSGTISDLLRMYAPNASSLTICVDGIVVTKVT
jgi:hypothetical protein